MRPFYLFILAILTPMGLATTLLVPLYAGILGACYAIYYADPHPLADKLLDAFYIIDVYGTLFHHLQTHLATLSVVEYTLPATVLPLLGFVTSIWLTRKLARAMMNLFHLSASVS